MPLLDLSPGELAFYGVVVLAASFVRGYSGFGFSAILMAGAGLALPLAEIVPLAISLEVLASIGQARQVWRDIDWRRLAVILITGVVGNPIGVWLLLAIPDETLLPLVYVFVATVAILLLISPRSGLRLSLPVLAAAGLVAGIVNGATALSGLVLALLFTMAGVVPATMRATLIAYFFATDLWTGSLLAAAGLYDATALWRIALALPLLAAGLWAGTNRFIGTAPSSFRFITLLLLLLLSALGLTRSFVM